MKQSLANVARYATVAFILAGCAAPESKYITRTVEVKIPIATRMTPPAELVDPYKPSPLPIFVAPDDPAARAALTREGIEALWAMIADLVARDQAWRAWASPVAGQPGDQE